MVAAMPRMVTTAAAFQRGLLCNPLGLKVNSNPGNAIVQCLDLSAIKAIAMALRLYRWMELRRHVTGGMAERVSGQVKKHRRRCSVS
jgi:hypothetical protein